MNVITPQPQTFLVYDERKELGNDGLISNPKDFIRDSVQYHFSHLIHASDEELNAMDLYRIYDDTPVYDGRYGYTQYATRLDTFTVSKDIEDNYKVIYDLEMLPFDVMQEQKIKEFTKARKNYLRFPFEYTATNDTVYSLDLSEANKTNLYQQLEYKNINELDLSDEVLWKMGDNKFKTITYDLIKEFLVVIHLEISRAFDHEAEKHTALEEAKIEQEILDIDWSLVSQTAIAADISTPE